MIRADWHLGQFISSAIIPKMFRLLDYHYNALLPNNVCPSPGSTESSIMVNFSLVRREVFPNSYLLLGLHNLIDSINQFSLLPLSG